MTLCFHPDILALQSKPTPPGKNTVAYVLASVFIVALLVASWAEIEVVTRAEGKIIPSSQVKIVRSSYTGLVSEVHAYDGFEVNAGDLLIRFDTRELLAQKSELVEELQDVTFRESVLNVFAGISYDEITATDDGNFELLLKNSGLNTLSAHRQWAVAELASLKDYAEQVMQDRDILKEKLRSSTIQSRKADAIGKLIKKDADAKRYIVDKGFGSKSEMTSEELRYDAAAYDSKDARQKMMIVKSELNALGDAEHSRMLQFQLSVLEELKSLKVRQRMLKHKLSGIEAQVSKGSLRSPVAGTVERMALTTSGVYVSTGFELMTIVPHADSVLVEVLISSQEVGFLRQGQSARVKIDSFPFTRYGSLPATLRYLSRDAAVDSEGVLRYLGRLSLEKDTFKVKNKTEPVHAGMSLQAEIITDKRPLIDFFLGPIRAVVQESFTER